MTTDFIIAYLISTHICLLFDMSPFQKRPVCKVNYALGTLIATLPAMTFSYFSTLTDSVEHFGVLAAITVASSILVITSIQKVLNYNIDF